MDIRFVIMNRSPTIPVCGVHTVSHAADGVDLASTPFLYADLSADYVCIAFLYVWCVGGAAKPLYPFPCGGG